MGGVGMKDPVATALGCSPAEVGMTPEEHREALMAEPARRVQIGWMNPETGVMCDCPVYETSPHANSVPVYREVPRER
jgi:hypothetical protein